VESAESAETAENTALYFLLDFVAVFSVVSTSVSDYKSGKVFPTAQSKKGMVFPTACIIHQAKNMHSQIVDPLFGEGILVLVQSSKMSGQLNISTPAKNYITDRHRLRIHPLPPPIIGQLTGLTCPECPLSSTSQLRYHPPRFPNPANINWQVCRNTFVDFGSFVC
jgi:hypothetical protein